MQIEPEIVLAAICCRRLFLLDGRHWSGSHGTGWGSAYDDPQAGVIGWSASELLGRSLDRGERRQATPALHHLAADGRICLIPSGQRTVAVEILAAIDVTDKERAAFEAWRQTFSAGALDAAEANHQAERDQREAERKREAAERQRQRLDQSKAYQQQRQAMRGGRRHPHGT